MNILFIHQNFPGQYVHVAKALAALPGNRVIALSQRQHIRVPGVEQIVYKPHRVPHADTHHYLRDAEGHVLNAQAVAKVALDLKRAGFVPDVMVGHNGWGEIWYLKDVFPQAPLLGYFEFFYRTVGADVGFDPEARATPDTGPRVRTKNIGNLLGLSACDKGICPTQWQKSGYPEAYHSMLEVIHEGIDTQAVAPDPSVRIRLPGLNVELSAELEVLTYVARNLEPYRGFPSFMRSLPMILEQRPKAQVLIVGGDDTSYGARLPDGQTYRQKMIDELGPGFKLDRVHFLGKLPYAQYLKVLQISRVHVYLTYPFVLSWSMLEAMSAGCLLLGSSTAPVTEVLREGENGLLVDFFDSEAIARKVVDALAHPQQYMELRRNARQTITQQYDLATICLPAQLKLVQELAA